MEIFNKYTDLNDEQKKQYTIAKDVFVFKVDEQDFNKMQQALEQQEIQHIQISDYVRYHSESISLIKDGCKYIFDKNNVAPL